MKVLICVGVCLALIVLAVSVVPAEKDPLAGFNDDEVSRAALELVWPLPDCNESWIGGTVKSCDEASARLSAMRDSYKTYSGPKRMKKALAHWFDYSEGRIKESRRDCVLQTTLKDLRKYQEDSAQESQRTREALAAAANAK